METYSFMATLVSIIKSIHFNIRCNNTKTIDNLSSWIVLIQMEMSFKKFHKWKCEKYVVKCSWIIIVCLLLSFVDLKVCRCEVLCEKSHKMCQSLRQEGMQTIVVKFLS